MLIAASNADEGVSVVPSSFMVYKRALLNPAVSFCAAANSVAKSVAAPLVLAP